MLIRLLHAVYRLFSQDVLGGTARFPFDLFKRLGYKNTSLIYACARISIGKDVSPTQDEYGCMESIWYIVRDATGIKIGTDYATRVSTTRAFEHMRIDRRRFAVMPFSKPQLRKGDILMFVTGQGNGNVSNGHIFVYMGGGKLLSNNSWTSKMDLHYTVDSAMEYYHVRGGYPAWIIRVLG